MKVESRIKEYPACQAIDLDENEKDVYRGAGWKLAAFDGGKLAALHSLDSYEYRADESFNETVERATKHNFDKLKNLEAEGFDCWLVMASCYQLCEPERLNADDALSAAKLARRIGEELADG